MEIFLLFSAGTSVDDVDNGQVCIQRFPCFVWCFGVLYCCSKLHNNTNTFFLAAFKLLLFKNYLFFLDRLIPMPPPPPQAASGFCWTRDAKPQSGGLRVRSTKFVGKHCCANCFGKHCCANCFGKHCCEVREYKALTDQFS